MRTLSVIVPCFNEEKTLAKVLDALLALHILDWNLEIVAVNDGSVDSTRTILDGYGNRIKAIHLEKNEGKGGAVKRGLAEATGDYMLIQDADLEYNPQEIKNLVAPLQPDVDGKKVVYGSRNLEGHIRSGFILSRLGVWFITRLINVLYRLKLTDVWTCYKLFPAQAKHFFTSGHFESELLFTTALARNGYTFTEVAISHAPRTVMEGKKIRYRDGFYGIYIVLQDYIQYHWNRISPRGKKLIIILALMIVASVAAGLKITHYITKDTNSDYDTYINTARYFSGDDEAIVYPQRILKPLAPGIVSLLAPMAGSNEAAFIIEVVFFYLALVALSYLFFETYFYGRKDLAVCATALFLFSYPMLRYGLALYTETGAWFFYMLALYPALLCIRKPSAKLVVLSAAASAVGFLWKEYSVVSFLILLAVIFFHSALSRREKIRLLLIACGVFGIINVLWQIYIFAKLHYSYFNWYGEGGVPGFKTEFTLVNLIKTPFALLMAAWLFVPSGIKSFKSINWNEKVFLIAATVAPCLFFLWGFISSRLFYIITPPLIIAAVAGLDRLFPGKYQKAAIICIIIAINIAWLVKSYH